MLSHNHYSSLGLHSTLRAVSDIQNTTGRIRLSAEEWHILTLVFRQFTVAEIAAQTNRSTEWALHMVGCLISLQLVTVVNECMPALDASAARPTAIGRAIRRRLEYAN